MAIISLSFPYNINISAQVGDVLYYCPQTSNNIETNFNTQNGDIVEIGIITNITHPQTAQATWTIDVDQTAQPWDDPNNTTPETIQGIYSTLPVANSDFIFFSKDNAVNTSSPLGYYAKAKFVNNSKIKSEMFAAACEMFESSK